MPLVKSLDCFGLGSRRRTKSELAASCNMIHQRLIRLCSHFRGVGGGEFSLRELHKSVMWNFRLKFDQSLEC